VGWRIGLTSFQYHSSTIPDAQCARQSDSDPLVLADDAEQNVLSANIQVLAIGSLLARDPSEINMRRSRANQQKQRLEVPGNG